MGHVKRSVEVGSNGAECRTLLLASNPSTVRTRPLVPHRKTLPPSFCWQGSQAVEVSVELKPLVARRHISAHSATFQAASSDISNPATGTVSSAKLQVLSAMFQWMYPASLRFIAAVHEITRHVLSTARVALDCHGVRLTDRDGDFNHEELLMIGLIPIDAPNVLK